MAGRPSGRLSVRSRVLALAAALLVMLIASDLFAGRVLERADLARQRQRLVGAALVANYEVRSAYADLRHRCAADTAAAGLTAGPTIDPVATMARITAALDGVSAYDPARAASCRRLQSSALVLANGADSCSGSLTMGRASCSH